MVASCHCQYLLPSSACGLHPSWGVPEILYFLGFPPLFSKPSTYRSPCDWHIVGAYDLVNGWGQKEHVWLREVREGLVVQTPKTRPETGSDTPWPH